MPDFDFDAVCGVARLAGQAIMEVYSTDFAVECKDDRSPLTAADKASHAVIAQSLSALHPDIPILSEEGAKIPHARRAGWDYFWLVDPLDGTKEFIKRNGEFTVCIALMRGRSPVFGVLYVPVKDILYAGGPGYGCLKVENGASRAVACRAPAPGETVVVVKSRSHPDERLSAYLEQFPQWTGVTAGSALKFGLLAEGAAHVYPRFNPTWEWDTAAGHAVVLGAGGSFRAMDGSEFLYNKPDLLNGGFEAKGW